jgi:hypothetical protein
MVLSHSRHVQLSAERISDEERWLPFLVTSFLGDVMSCYRYSSFSTSWSGH